ncbi:hypothetical protein, partial [Tannerella forsythia]|uniref:hypothetical protein n=1 Tax=Tannerella forsythia TaxID=28112 RepID=UPI0028E40942
GIEQQSKQTHKIRFRGKVWKNKRVQGFTRGKPFNQTDIAGNSRRFPKKFVSLQLKISSSLYEPKRKTRKKNTQAPERFYF